MFVIKNFNVIMLIIINMISVFNLHDFLKLAVYIYYKVTINSLKINRSSTFYVVHFHYLEDNILIITCKYNLC